MTIYAISAPMGEGKTHTAMRYTRELLKRGVFVATNVIVRAPFVFPPVVTETFCRLPRCPTVKDLLHLSVVRTLKDISRNGVVVLDDFDVILQSPICHGVRDWVLTCAECRWDALITFRLRHLIDDELRALFGRFDTLLPPHDSMNTPTVIE
jgi:hypothetical protein